MALQTRRRVRHWKQRFDPKASYVWARNLVYNGKAKKPGQRVDKRTLGPNKLFRLWSSRFIEQADWKPPVVHDPHRVEVPSVGAVG